MYRTDRNRQKTILGYHDKSENNYSLIKPGLYPILNDETYSPFLLTKDRHFSISTNDITTLINNHRALSRISNIKNIIAQVLIIPGLIISILFLVQMTGTIDPESSIGQISQSNLVSFAFWLSMLGVVILWHDYYRTRSHPLRLPSIERIQDKDISSIKNFGIKFNKYITDKAIYYLDDANQELLVEFSTNQGLSIYRLFRKLLNTEEVRDILNRADLGELLEADLSQLNITDETLPHYELPSTRSILMYALNEALLTSSRQITPMHLMLALFEVFPVLNDYLHKSNSSIDMLREVIQYHEEKQIKIDSNNILNTEASYYRNGGIFRTWIYGYTFYLSKFTTSINQKVLFENNTFGIGHQREVEELAAVTGRLNQNNSLLIGEPGVGKSSIVKGLAQRMNWGNVPKQLKDKEILQLDINKLMAQASSKNIEEIIVKAMQELEKAGNIILYIDEMQTLISGSKNDSNQNLTNTLLPYIIDGKFPIIGTINYSDYRKYLYDMDSLRQSFESVEVAELSAESTLKILKSKIPNIEKNFQLYVTMPALTTATELAQRYINERKLPDSAVSVLETAASYAQNENKSRLTSELVEKSVSIQTSIPVERVTAEEATRLINLEESMKEVVIGQDEAVHAVVESLKRARTEIRDSEKPIGTFLFLGPTGTGKTHLSKKLHEAYFGAESEIIRIDMSEYQQVDSIDKFLGSNQASGQYSTSLIDKVKHNPFTVILFDEIEKAHPQVLDIFLQLFDEGRLTSNNGETVSFNNTIMICTSNIGSQNLLQALERDRSMWDEAKQQALLELRGQLRPEMINRFDKIVVFSPHDIENLVKITSLILNQLSNRLGSKGLSLEWTDSIPMLIANYANQPGMGARPIKRYVQEKVESKIADEILKSQIGPGDQLEIKESWLTEISQST